MGVCARCVSSSWPFVSGVNPTRGSTLAGEGPAHGQDAGPLRVWGASDPLDFGELAASSTGDSPHGREHDLRSAIRDV